MEMSSQPHPNSNNGAGNGMKERMETLQDQVFKLEEQKAETQLFHTALLDILHECQDNLTNSAIQTQNKIDDLQEQLDTAENLMKHLYLEKCKHI